jgi:hypothetical protein
MMAKELLSRGVGTLILEGPYYGARRPGGQVGSKLRHVADLIKLGAITIIETLCLIRILREVGVERVRAQESQPSLSNPQMQCTVCGNFCCGSLSCPCSYPCIVLTLLLEDFSVA